MPVKLGGLGISKVYVGGTPVKVYLGDTLLLDTAVTPPPTACYGRRIPERGSSERAGEGATQRLD